ncbi:tRNA-dihydrouridine(16,17) synthase [NAD(P)(+)], partial [Sarracenia purpurea var. burkii]
QKQKRSNNTNDFHFVAPPAPSGGDGRRFRCHRLHHMRFKPSSSSAAAVTLSPFTDHMPYLNSSLSPISSFMAASSSLSSLPAEDLDNGLCSEPTQSPNHHHRQEEEQGQQPDCSLGTPSRYLSGESRIERAWSHWNKLGRPKMIVAPMVDNSELPFRMLCRKYGADAAYTPMLHSRIFTENEKYRSQEFTTCKVRTQLFMHI